MIKYRKFLLWIFGLFSCLFLFGILTIGSAGYWLSKDDDLVESEIIIVLAGEPERALYAADLYLRGYGYKVFVSRPVIRRSSRILDSLGINLPSTEDINRQVLLRSGVPGKNIRIFGKGSVSTFEEAKAINQIIDTNIRRILVVTSPFHVKRARMIFQDIVTNYEIRVIGTPYIPFPKHWWTNQESAINVVLEVSKILFYWAGGRFYQYE